MLKKIHFMGMMISVFIFMLFSSTSYPQFNDYGSKIGVQLNGLLPDTEFEKEFKVLPVILNFPIWEDSFLDLKLLNS